ncbi:MAG: GNAT family N-acetyltransferase [Dehalococcoidia bacterium]
MTEIRLTSVVLRGWALGDATSLARHANNRNIWRNFHDGFPSPYTEEDAREWVESQVGIDPPQNFAIDVDGEAAGGIGFELAEADNIYRGTAGIGYWLGEAFWGRGIMSEAVAAVTTYAWQTFPFERLEAWPFERNSASRRVLEKAGYVLEGRAHNRVRKEGELMADLLYAAYRPSSATL